MRFFAMSVLAAILLCIPVAAGGEDNTGEQIGRKVDRAVDKLGEGAKDVMNQVRRGFEEARNAVDRLSIEGRVYARLHWDKALHESTFSVDVGRDGVTTIRGTVPSDPAKAKAERLASETVGVERVVNELQISAPAAR